MVSNVRELDGDQVRLLRDQLDGVTQAAQTSSVDQALLLVRQLASRPPNVFDAYALIGALEHLEDVARRAGHGDVKKFTAVLCNCKKLPPSPRLATIQRQRYEPYLVPEWEIQANFNPMVASGLFHTRIINWKTLPGNSYEASVLDNLPKIPRESPEAPLVTTTPVLVRDPECFLAGEIHKHPNVWNKLTENLPNRNEIMGWITQRVSVGDFVQPFK
ncbi:hypothetical protein QZH41_003889 [Actinostola sp. cb2023]|nr:hypothetical protein QZH41_003889 [Actinostola sp. cb2023]